MANFLYQLGAVAARRRWLVLVAWVTVLAAAGVGAATLSKPTSSSITIPGTESQRAIELLAEKFPGTGGASARIVVAAPTGHVLTEATYTTLASDALTALAKAPQVISVSGFTESTLSADKRIAYADVSYAVAVADITDESKEALETIVAPARAAGLQVEFSGGVISTTEEAGSSSELYGMIIAYFVLALTLGGLVIAGMPLLNALFGVGIGMLGIQVVTGFVTLNSTAPALATMLGLAVGIDYALFIVARHRQQVRDGMDVHESIAIANGTAGSAVVFAGVTVVIALCGLAVAGIPFLTVMGLCAAATVAVTVLLAITLIPAILGFSGARIATSHIGFLSKRGEPKANPFGQRWARIATARPWLTVIACLAVVGAMAFPVLDMNLGLPSDGTKSTGTTERRAYDLLAEGFGDGFNAPLTLVLSGPGRTDMAAVATKAAAALSGDADIAVAVAAATNKAGDVSILSVIPKSGPDSQETKELVNRIRAAGKQAQENGITPYVTGTTAFNNDVSDKLSSALAPFLVLIVVLALVLLLLVFRSILVPVKAAAGFLLSLGASMGMVTFVFQQGHLGGVFGIEATGPILSFLPVLVIGILFGLAMDYEVFLVSRVKEAFTHHGDARQAISDGMRDSARVVTAAGLIMTAVFAAFIFGSDATIKAIGFSLAIGVVVDAFIVRMTLVPAVLHLLGRSAWWLPQWLGRILPNVDIEGAALVQPAAGGSAHLHHHAGDIRDVADANRSIGLDPAAAMRDRTAEEPHQRR
ncbi:MMPL family transporter [Actinoplanes rectilineatus]|uniref:MMPL family transporter n=1 Tax=Actinoplanes rectilineatus TaxID=113571 RepID=UPI0007C848AF|nr:MMPL family transporter [Actinoplanes rectilineatus]